MKAQKLADEAELKKNMDNIPDDIFGGQVPIFNTYKRPGEIIKDMEQRTKMDFNKLQKVIE